MQYSLVLNQDLLLNSAGILSLHAGDFHVLSSGFHAATIPGPTVFSHTYPQAIPPNLTIYSVSFKPRMNRYMRARVPRIIRYVKDTRRRMPRNPGLLGPERNLPFEKTHTVDLPATCEALQDTGKFYRELGVTENHSDILAVKHQPSKFDSNSALLPRLFTADGELLDESQSIDPCSVQTDDGELNLNQSTGSIPKLNGEGKITIQPTRTTSDNPLDKSAPSGTPPTSNDEKNSLLAKSQVSKESVVKVTQSRSLAHKTFKMMCKEFGGAKNAIDAISQGRTAVETTSELLNEAIINSIYTKSIDEIRALIIHLKKACGPIATDFPNTATDEILVHAMVKKGMIKEALTKVACLKSTFNTGIAAAAHNNILVYMKMHHGVGAMRSYFNCIIEKADPSSSIPGPVVGTMLLALATEDRVEEAFALYSKLSGTRSESISPLRRPSLPRLEPNADCHTALIYACSRRKEYFERGIKLFREMEVLGLKMNIQVYNHLLNACAKTSDLRTAMELWRAALSSPELRPSAHTVAAYLWVLASVEIPDGKAPRSVHRPLIWKNLTAHHVATAARDVVEWARSNGIPIAAPAATALVAAHANNGLTEIAEKIFWRLIAGNGLKIPSHQLNAGPHEVMLKMYDTNRDMESARKVLENYRSMFTKSEGRSCTFLGRKISSYPRPLVRLPYEGWRAAARTAAICNEYEESLSLVYEMREMQGYTPNIEDLKLLVMRFSEAGRNDLCRILTHLCTEKRAYSNQRSVMSLENEWEGNDTVTHENFESNVKNELVHKSAGKALIGHLNDSVDLPNSLKAIIPSPTAFEVCESDTSHKNDPHRPWLQRSIAVSELLKSALGKEAPKLATDPKLIKDDFSSQFPKRTH
jgi:pentatricopeptide repeat protein